MTEDLSTAWDIEDGSQQSPCNSGVLGEQNVQSLKSFWSGVAGLGLIAVCSCVAAVAGERVFEESLRGTCCGKSSRIASLLNGGLMLKISCRIV